MSENCKKPLSEEELGKIAGGAEVQPMPSAGPIGIPRPEDVLAGMDEIGDKPFAEPVAKPNGIM